jgi:predicted ArsR family transcriptional regulator
VPARETSPIEVHKALADDTRFRLYRYLGLSDRPVTVRELATRLSLHPNTVRPHLRRLEEAGLIRRETRRTTTSTTTPVGRPQTRYVAVDRAGRESGNHKLLAEVLAGMVTGARARDRASALAAEWGEYLAVQGGPKPGTRLPAVRNLAVLQEAMAQGGFDPRFRRGGEGTVEISLRDCPFRDLLDDHRELRPPLVLASFEPLAERSICRLVARPRSS